VWECDCPDPIGLANIRIVMWSALASYVSGADKVSTFVQLYSLRHDRRRDTCSCVRLQAPHRAALHWSCTMPHSLLTIAQAADRIQMSPVTVTHWAYRRRPAPAGFPEPVHINRNLRYVAHDIDEWIEGLRRHGASQSVERSVVATVARRRGRPRKMPAVEDRKSWSAEVG